MIGLYAEVIDIDTSAIGSNAAAINIYILIYYNNSSAFQKNFYCNKMSMFNYLILKIEKKYQIAKCCITKFI